LTRLARFIYKKKVVKGRLSDDELIDEKHKHYPISEVEWLPPTNPSNIVGLVLNYADHADELGLSVSEDPIIFLKPTSTLVGHMQDIIRPEGVKFMHYEGELAIVIGRDARKVNAKDALEFVSGYTIANDVTVRDYITNTFRPPVRAKGFDTFCPLGPYIVTKDEIDEPGELDLTTRVNGETKQKSNTKMFLHPIPKVLEFVSSFMTLRVGDVILTGTPRGIAPVSPGDVIEITVSQCGTLRNRVVPETSRKMGTRH